MKADFTVENHGAVVLLNPRTKAAQAWVDEHIVEEYQTWGNALVIENRYAWDIIEGLSADGLEVE